MNSIRKLKCIDALTLKLFAMFFMLCDHMWATVISGNQILTDIGRLAFPIFAFQLVEAFYHTHDRKSFLKRLFVFALISEIPFNLMMGGSIFYPFHQNVMFTFLIALLCMAWMEHEKQSGKIWRFVIVVLISGILGFTVGTLTLVDYFGFGVLTVFLFYLTREVKFGWILQLVGMYWINVVLMGGQVIMVSIAGYELEIMQQGLAILSLIFIWLYNGKRGAHNKAIQISYYAFYPVHMLIVALLALYVV